MVSYRRIKIGIGTGELSYIGRHYINATITTSSVDYQDYIVYGPNGTISFV